MVVFTEPTQIQLHYRIVTPMFLGSENQQADATHFRNASYKGALRFWWRALNWGVALEKSQKQQDAALQWLHQKEGELFGLACDGKGSRQSLVQIHSNLKNSRVKKPCIALYLLGQGLSGRGYLEGGELEIKLLFKIGTSDEDIQSIEKAATALGLFGGLGSRSRRGLGSLSLTVVTKNGEEEKFDTIGSIQNFINTLNFTAPKDAPLSAFTEASRIDISATGDSAIQALQAISKEMQMYRSFGRNGKVNGQDSRFNFKDDHDKVLAASKGTPLQEPPQRAVFGLPHNYYFSSDTKVEITTADEGRRASPLLIHIHALEKNKFIAIQTLLPGMFLPAKTEVNTKTTKLNGREIKNPKLYAIGEINIDFNVITRYLDGDGKHNGFPQRQTLKDPNHG